MIEHRTPPAGAVLTGGESRRMGRDKALVAVEGIAMAMRVAKVLERAGCRPVGAIGGDLVSLAAVGLEGIPDDHPGQGPLGGIITALRWSRGAVLVAACDLPWLDAAAIDAVLAAAADPSNDHPQAVVACTDRVEPLLAWWSSEALPVLEDLFDGGERAVHRALEQLRVVSVVVDASALRNVNAPGDLDAG